MDKRLLRIEAVAAITGDATQLVASALEPDWASRMNRRARCERQTV